MLSVSTLALLTARHARRRARRHAAHDRQRLESLLREPHASTASAATLRHTARVADAEVLWAAVETLSIAPVRVRRRAGELLERNPYVVAERRALRDDSPWRRELAARRLALLPSPPSRRALRRALVGGPELVTLAAAAALAQHRDRAALRWVLAHGPGLSHRTPRATVALLRSFGPRTLPDIAAALERGTTNPRLERAMIEALGLGCFQAAGAAIAARLQSSELDVRVASARALGRLKSDQASVPLMLALDDPEWPVRAQAAWALGRIGTPEAVAPLVARLSDLAWWVRRHAAYALLELGEPGHRALTEVGARAPDPYARDMACEALAGGFPTRAA